MSNNKPPKYLKLRREVAFHMAQFIFELGTQFMAAKNFDAAKDCFIYVLEMFPETMNAAHNLGVMFSMTANHEAAYKMFKRCAQMSHHKDIVEEVAYAEACRKFNKLEEAREVLKRCVEVAPDHFLTKMEQSMVAFDSGDIETAAVFTSEALAISPGDGPCRLNQTLINMTLGRWVENWGDYENRLTTMNPNNVVHSVRTEKYWRGQPVESLLVIADQGSGDTINWCRYFKKIRELAGPTAKIKLYCQPALTRLLAPLVDQVYGHGQVDRIEHESYITMIGVCDLLKISPQNCGDVEWPYITPPKYLVESMGFEIERATDGLGLPAMAGRPKVGLVWAGDPKHGHDHRRSMALKDLDRLVNLPAAFFSLQVGPASAQLRDYPSIVQLGDRLRSFEDTAAAIAHMDLVVAVDTSVAHLAGAMGKETWLMMFSPPEWRWGASGTTTPWYPTMTLFRQPAPKDWRSPATLAAMRLATRLGVEYCTMED